MFIQLSNSFTWEFLTVVVLFIVSILAVIQWLLPARLRLEKELQSNYQTITRLKYDLAKLSDEKEMKEQIISIVIHDLKSPLRFLSMHMKNLQENFKGMNSEELNRYSLLLKNTVNNTYSFTQEVLLWLNNQNGDVNIIKKRIDIQEFINKTATLYEDICLSNNNQLEIAIQPGILINTASDLLNVIIRNLLDDANKFTKNGRITITASLTDKLAHITIADTGIGMTQEKTNELINYDLNNWNTKDTCNHLGYKIINDLIRQLGGSISIISELKKGTSVTVMIPIA